MSKISIVGNVAVITSTLQLETLKTIKKYRPKALTLMGGENNKEPIFCIEVGSKGNGELNGNGAYFTEHTRDDQKLACITVSLNGVEGDVKEYLADRFGEAMMHLNALEATLPTVLTDVKAQKDAVMAAISVI